MTTIQKVTQEEFKQKFANLAKNVLGCELNPSHVAVISERQPSKIAVVESSNFLSALKERGFQIPTSMEDVAVVSVVGTTQRNTTGKKMKR